MKEELYEILEEAKKEVKKIKDKKLFDELRVKFLGKKGELRNILGKLGALGVEEKKEIGQAANEVKDKIQELIDEAAEKIEKQERAARLKKGVPDISVSRTIPPIGYYHPLTVIRDKMIGVFKNMGFSVEEGPELEEEYYNFDALNMPWYHPARDSHDSFYITKGKLMRTHTSPMQARIMQKRKPPLAVVVPGRCFRRDAVDATHSHTFHQMEGLVVDKNITFADLKGTLLTWAKMMFGPQTSIRMRPDYFPFTEPSAELAVTCPICAGKKCSVCKHTGWIEIAGCGLVDPEVFKNIGYDPEQVSGFAFGMGLERIAMVVYGIRDIRYFYENDMRLIEQFVK
ncbi:MAG: phenylalanine--tRNA ligase subunit alpha [Spirochaetes bacterium GWF1_51_8]|nr:MAG: phenylalanine--tRNA ligase subunit alpha [Spirochaetes bacterium GWF1_51_8]